MMPIKTNILILGAGIGGYRTFQTLAKLLKRYGFKQTITIVDQNNYFTFTPLLHEVAGGSVEPTHATIPLRELIYKTPHTFLKATVEHLDPAKKLVKTSAGVITYDYCVLALGSTTNYYNVPGAKENSYHVRSLVAAIKLRHNLIAGLETAESEFKIVVAGGGYTGVETAGQLAYFTKNELSKLYPNTKITISLIHNQSRLAPFLPEKVSAHIFKRLSSMGVAFFLNKKIARVAKTAVELDDGEIVNSDLTIWCTGFENMATCFLDDPFCLNGRVPTTPQLNHEQQPSLYAIGDIAYSTNVGSSLPQPQLGEVAYAEGSYVARHIIAALRNQTIKPFFYKSKGSLMPIGDWYGVAIFGKLIFFGRLAWWLRRTVYLLFIPGLVRKLKIICDWTLHVFGFGNIIMVERDRKEPEV